MGQGDEKALEVVKDSVPEEMTAAGAVTRLVDTTQMTFAVQNPRNEKAILEDALRELETYPVCAEDALYIKPVGRDAEGSMKYAEGLSVRTAENLANRWVNSAYSVDVIAEDEDSVTIQARFLDVERNTMHHATKKVSKFYTTRQKATVRHPVDRFHDVIVPANKSKLLREIILRSLPSGLKQEYEMKARTMLMEGIKHDLATRVTKMLVKFQALGVTADDIKQIRGREKMSDFTAEDVAELAGVFNALRDGDTTKEQLLGQKPPEKSEAPPLKPVAASTPEPEQKPEEAGTGAEAGDDNGMDIAGTLGSIRACPNLEELAVLMDHINGFRDDMDNKQWKQVEAARDDVRKKLEAAAKKGKGRKAEGGTLV